MKSMRSGKNISAGDLSSRGSRTDNRSAEEKKSAAKRIATMEDIDRVIHFDNVEYATLKDDFRKSQEHELERAQRELADLQTEYDQLRTINNGTQKELHKTMDNVRALDGVRAASVESHEEFNKLKGSLLQQTSQANEYMGDETRTYKMQMHMFKRLEDEVVECRSGIANGQYAVEQLEIEKAIFEAHMRMCRQEFMEQERILNQLLHSMKTRRRPREEKVETLQALVLRTEQSVVKVQEQSQSVFDEYSGELSNELNGQESFSKKSNDTISSTKTGMSFRKQSEQDFNPEFAHYKVDQVKEMVSRYRSRKERCDKLTEVDTDLKDAIVRGKERTVTLKEGLVSAIAEHSQLSSNRQIYQEMDEQEKALHIVQKECEESKEKEATLRLQLESLARALPRFLSKITKVPHSINSIDQIPDAVYKLEDEISKLIKSIDTAMLKEATAEDLAAIGGSEGMVGAPTSPGAAGGEGQTSSEIARLQKLPGFSRLTRKVYSNIMCARPDVSDRNVRVRTLAMRLEMEEDADAQNVAGKRNMDLSRHFSAGGGRGSKGSGLFSTASGIGGAASAVSIEADGTPASGVQNQFYCKPGEHPLLDRDTLKKISHLVMERDPGFKQREAARIASLMERDEDRHHNNHGHGHGHGQSGSLKK
jgi:hypothetical protein